MADIAPFRGLLYTPRLDPSDVLAPLVDTPAIYIDDARRATLARKHERNCVHLLAPQAEDGGDRYQHAAATLEAWCADGTLVRDDRPAIYRYHQTFTSTELGEHTVTRSGFIAAVRLHDFDDGVILPHRHPRNGPLADRLSLMDACQAHLSPIFAMYSDPSGETDRLFVRAENMRPLLDGTTDDGTRHRLWRVTNREVIGKLKRLLAPMKLYIAEGQHRYQSMLALRDRLSERAGGALAHQSAAQFGTMFLANMSDLGLVILPTHRLIHSVDGFSPEDLLQAATEYFDISTIENGALNVHHLRAALGEASTRRPSFAAVWPFHDHAALFSVKESVVPEKAGLHGHPALTSLDVSLLHGLVLDNLLGIDRAAQDAQTNIRYVNDTQKALDAIADCQAQVCFIMNATRVEQVKAVADAHQVMPPHSTFFFPRLASGVVFNPIDIDEQLG